MASEILAPAASTNHSAISKVRVVARVRPFLPLEGSVKSYRVPVSCISVLDQAQISQEEVTVHLKDPETRYLFFVSVLTAVEESSDSLD